MNNKASLALHLFHPQQEPGSAMETGRKSRLAAWLKYACFSILPLKRSTKEVFSSCPVHAAGVPAPPSLSTMHQT